MEEWWMAFPLGILNPYRLFSGRLEGSPLTPIAMSRATTSTTLELPGTISGLWSLCALSPFHTRAAYEEAAALCGKFSVRRLNAVLREYFRELTELVEAYDDEKGETVKTVERLKKLALARE